MIPDWIHFQPPSDGQRAIRVSGPLGPNAQQQAFVHGHVPPEPHIDMWMYAPDHPEGTPAEDWAAWAEVPAYRRSRDHYVREVSTVVTDFAGWSNRESTPLTPRVEGVAHELNLRWSPPVLYVIDGDVLEGDEPGVMLDDVGTTFAEFRDRLVEFHAAKEQDWAEAEAAHAEAFAKWRAYATQKQEALFDAVLDLRLDSDHRIAKAAVQMAEQLKVYDSPETTNERRGGRRGSRHWERLEDNVEEIRSWIVNGGRSPKEEFQRRWIHEFGSDHLRLAADADQLDTVQPQFYAEYLEAELPGWDYVHPDDPLAEGEGFREVRNPTDVQLRALRYVQVYLPVVRPRLVSSGSRTVIFGVIKHLEHRRVVWESSEWDHGTLNEMEMAAVSFRSALSQAERDLADAQARAAAASAEVESRRRAVDNATAALRAAERDLSDAHRAEVMAKQTLDALRDGADFVVDGTAIRVYTDDDLSPEDRDS